MKFLFYDRRCRLFTMTLLLSFCSSLAYGEECSEHPDTTNINCNNRARIMQALKEDKYVAPDSDALDKQCSRYEKTPIPDSDLPTAKEKQELSKCDSALFYSIHHDYVKARKCAYLERDRESAGWPDLGGAARLMQIYQTGKGVIVNHDLAIKFACEWGKTAAEAEYEGLLQGLLGQDQNVLANFKEHDFSVCVVATGGGLSSACDYESLKVESYQLDAGLMKLKSAWSENTVEAYQKLKASVDKFIEDEARFTQLQNTAGGSWVSYWITEETREKLPMFYDKVKSIETGGLPEKGLDQFPVADKKLNQEYQNLVKFLKQQEGADYVIAVDLLKKAQLSWIAYRDRFELFGQSLAKPLSFKTFLTNERSNQLVEYRNSYELP